MGFWWCGWNLKTYQTLKKTVCFFIECGFIEVLELMWRVFAVLIGFHMIHMLNWWTGFLLRQPDYMKQGIIAEVSMAGWRGRGCWSLHYCEGDTHLVEDCWIVVKQHPTRTRDLPLIFSKFVLSTLFSLMPQRIGTDGNPPLFQVREPICRLP